ncbi:hypothetical protein A2480_04275 [Candidatus Uhrbacteria bacterium RIFOXYC2_FULL_47_19]|uniref:Uncharacterized protein n=1 Tax=Candidatus Uhrbacteria bacterium RIFOXYC2_FULL_47_19 TaxID=1802424 RepID=A0A1F7WCD3_9BACT|nr:MAG: hypothetical protein A2480_04275 [Candidatus Uhrbacteria bacterium RIFOXYC2_FULL_47_19]
MRTLGIERECFIIDSSGSVVPAIGKLLPRVFLVAERIGVPQNLFSFELFAGQIEERTPPCRNFEEIKKTLSINGRILSAAISSLGLSFDYSEFVEEHKVGVFEVNPFDRRHRDIWSAMSLEKRVAASVVAAVHVHISVSKDEVVRVLNLCREETVNRLVHLGDHSRLRRMTAYRIVSGTDGIPPEFDDFSEVMNYISSQGGEKNVWDLVRYKPSTGTIEFRMFGTTSSVDEIVEYIRVCRDLFDL